MGSKWSLHSFAEIKKKGSVVEKRGAWGKEVGLGPCYMCIHTCACALRRGYSGVEWREIGERDPGEES